MKTGKQIIMEYCGKYTQESIEHIQNAIDVKYFLKNDKIDSLVGYCPSSYGLNDFTGECDDKEYSYSEDAHITCKRCWGKALNKTI